MDPEPSSLSGLILQVFLGFDPAYLLPLILVLILIVFSALVSGSEVAFFSLKPTEIDELKNSGNTQDDLILKMLETPRRLLATILISNNLINVSIILLMAYLTGQMFDFSTMPILGYVIEVVAITLLILLFGEIIPKVYATSKTVDFARFMSKPMLKCMHFFQPVSTALMKTDSIIVKRRNSNSGSLSVDDLEHALELAGEDATTDEEQKILKGIVKFGSTTVKQVMTPRMDVVMLNVQTPFAEVLEAILESGYSRIPVYDQNTDNIKGILYIKDLLPYIDADPGFDWKQLLRTTFYVPENKKIDDLLKEFQAKRVHLAIVVDEFGGTSGLVTLEDIIEEIVGEISDEFDDDELVYSKLDDHTYVFEGKTPVSDFCRVIDVDPSPFDAERGEAETLAGFLLEIHGKFPVKGDLISFENYRFVVENITKRRIQRVKVMIEEPIAPSPDAQ